MGSWWRLGGLCEIPRCLLGGELRHHCPMNNVPCVFFNKCLYLSYYLTEYLLDRPCIYSFTGDFSLGKSQKSQGTKSGLWGGLSHLGDLMFCQKTLNETMHEWACFRDQLPIAVAFWIIRMVSAEECSSLTRNLMQICCSTHSFWMQWLHSTHAYSRASIAPTD